MNDAAALETKLLPEPPLLVLPSLALAVGLNEAIVLQQLHYRARVAPDGWWRAHVGELRAEFPFWSANTVKRAVSKLRKAGLLEVRQAGTDRTNQYRVQYEAVQRLNSAPVRVVPSAHPGPIPIGRSSKRKNDKKAEGSARDFSRFDEAMKR